MCVFACARVRAFVYVCVCVCVCVCFFLNTSRYIERYITAITYKLLFFQMLQKCLMRQWRLHLALMLRCLESVQVLRINIVSWHIYLSCTFVVVLEIHEFNYQVLVKTEISIAVSSCSKNRINQVYYHTNGRITTLQYTSTTLFTMIQNIYNAMI